MKADGAEATCGAGVVHVDKGAEAVARRIALARRRRLGLEPGHGSLENRGSTQPTFSSLTSLTRSCRSRALAATSASASSSFSFRSSSYA